MNIVVLILLIAMLIFLVYKGYHEKDKLLEQSKKEEALNLPNFKVLLSAKITEILNRCDFKYVVSHEGCRFQLGFNNEFDDSPRYRTSIFLSLQSSLLPQVFHLWILYSNNKHYYTCF